MKDDLVEHMARAMAEADGYHPDEPTYASGGTGVETTVYERRWQKYLGKARAAYDVARPAILEEAAKAIQCDCCDVCGESPDYEYVCANELAARVRSLIPVEERK